MHPYQLPARLQPEGEVRSPVIGDVKAEFGKGWAAVPNAAPTIQVAAARANVELPKTR